MKNKGNKALGQEGIKCILGKSCLYCGTNYCEFVDKVKQLKKEITELKAENEKLKEVTNTAIIEQEKLVGQVNKYSQCLKEIQDIVSEPCIDGENCNSCKSNCMNKDILDKINEVIGAE